MRDPQGNTIAMISAKSGHITNLPKHWCHDPTLRD